LAAEAAAGTAAEAAEWAASEAARVAKIEPLSVLQEIMDEAYQSNALETQTKKGE